MQYSQSTFTWIIGEKNNIDKVSNYFATTYPGLNDLGSAIAAQMAKEKTLYDQSPLANVTQDITTTWYSDAAIRRDFADVNTLKIANTQTTLGEKLEYSTLNDLGYSNVKLQTAIQALKDASPADISGLGLSGYVSDYAALANDLATNSNGAAAKIYGLVMADGVKFFSVDHPSTVWDNATPQEQDALLVTFASVG
ncbi:MAG TPA: hypothetical protein VIE65_22405, partial [Methylobacter sp.]